MPATITFTRHKLATFLACQRRFQLRYLHEYPWPAPPHDVQGREAARRGGQFHRLLLRHFLGMEVDDPSGDPLLGHWWRTFRREGPALPAGRRLPELTLTVPLDKASGGGHLLSGRFDLVILADERVHIYDWKTTGPRPEAELSRDWQTRLYLALAVEGGSALFPGGKAVAPQQVALTYWFVRAPSESVTIRYDVPTHRRSWAEIAAVVEQIEVARTREGPWPLTDDLQTCARCRYQVLCGRREAVAARRRQAGTQPSATSGP